MISQASPLRAVAPPSIEPAKPPIDDRDRSVPGAWWTVAVLFLLYIFANIDRTVITMLVQPIKKDLGIGDFAMGLLLGPAFGMFFAACGLLMGMAVDRFSRRWVLFLGITAWSAAASLCGMASNYAILFVGRAGVGVGEATLSPIAYSLVADLFPRRRLATALSIYSSAVVVGTAIALAGSGLAIELLHTQALIWGVFKPWQFLFIVTGLPGFALALLAFTITDPRLRGAARIALSGDDQGDSFLRFMLARPRLYGGIFIGVGFMVVNSYAMLGWIPTYLMRVLHEPPREAGLTFGLIVVIAGGVGQIMSGLIVDRWTARGHLDSPLRYLMISSSIMVVPAIASFFVPGKAAFVLLVSSFFLLSMPMMGYSAAGVQMITPPRLRGRASATFLFTVTLMGVALGTPTVGLLTDYVFHDPLKLGWALALVLLVFTPLSIATMGWGRKALREAPRY